MRAGVRALVFILNYTSKKGVPASGGYPKSSTFELICGQSCSPNMRALPAARNFFDPSGQLRVS